MIKILGEVRYQLIGLILVLSILFSTLGSLGPFSAIYESTRLVVLAIATIVTFLLFAGSPQNPRSIVIGYILFIASGLLSLATHEPTTARIADFFQYCLYFLAIWLLAASYSPKHPVLLDNHHLDRLLYAVGLSLFIYSCLSLMIYVWFLRDGGGRLDAHIPYGFINIRYWSHLATWFLPLVPTLLWRVRDASLPRYFEWGVLFGAGIWVWILFITTARGSMVSILLAGVVVAVFMGRAGRLWLRDMFKVIAAGLAIWVLLSYVVLEWIYPVEATFRQLHGTTSGRIDLWLKAWELSLENFPFGIGPLGWISPAVGSRFGHPHNMVLMWAAEWGWLAVVGLLVIAISTLRRFLSLRRTLLEKKDLGQSMRVAGLLASVIAALAHAQLSAVFIAPPSMLVGFWILALFMAVVWQPWVQQEAAANVINKERKLTPAIAAYATLSVVLFVGWYAVLDYYRYMEHKIYVEQEFYPMAPRFWLYGQVQNFEK